MGKTHCSHCQKNNNQKTRINNKLLITGGVFVLIFIISFLPNLEKLNESFISYFKIIWWAVAIGLLIGGIIDYFIPEEMIFKYLGQKKKSSLFYALISGFVLSACSHGILAIAIQLYKKGASIPAVITFLLASPWANLPLTILMFGFFGWKTLIFVSTAMLIALVTGSIFSVLERKGIIEKSKEVQIGNNFHKSRFDYNFKDSFRGVMRGILNLANMVLWWLLIGILVAVLIKTYVPEEWMMNFFGASFVGLLLTLLVATIIEICSEGSAPIAFEIFKKTGVFGNPFVFLMAGVVTDYTEIGLIWTNIGKKTAIWLPIITVPQVLLFGYLFNIFL